MKEARTMIGSTVGQIEKKTQQRVVRLFREQLGYDDLGGIHPWPRPLTSKFTKILARNPSIRLSRHALHELILSQDPRVAKHPIPALTQG